MTGGCFRPPKPSEVVSRSLRENFRSDTYHVKFVGFALHKRSSHTKEKMSLVKTGLLVGSGAALAMYCTHKLHQFRAAQEAKKRERDSFIEGILIGMKTVAGGALLASGVYGFCMLRNKFRD